MADRQTVDGVLVLWGDRLFYPGNRTVKGRPERRWRRGSLRERADTIRARIEATVVRRAPQVMVKVTGGGRGIKAIAAHFRYISKNGRLDIEDENGTTLRGKDAVRELTEDWRYAGSLIGEEAGRREAYNIMLSMPRGSADAMAVWKAAQAFAKEELAGHKYVMVLHDHQANPHVHISVRAEGKDGRRLNPRKADLHRWRETFAEKLRELGVEAEATRLGTRVQSPTYDPLWRLKARQEGRLLKTRLGAKSGSQARATRAQAAFAWRQISQALALSGDAADRHLAQSVDGFIKEMLSTQVQGGPVRTLVAASAELPSRAPLTR